MTVMIPENFVGYVKIDENRYAYSVNGHQVKLLPAFEGKEKNVKNTDGIIIGGAINREYKYIYGYDETLYRIAMLQPSNLLQSVMSISFFAPIIIKSKGNADGFYEYLSKEWEQYDAITFSGGIINNLYNPKLAALKIPTTEEVKERIRSFDGARSIEIKSFDQYSHTIEIEINGQKADMMFSVSQIGGEDNLNTTDLGSLKSFVQIQFKDSQCFISIQKYIQTIRKLFALLSRQSNIFFDVSLKQRIHNEKFFETGICKVFMDNEDVYIPKLNQIVEIIRVFDYLPNMIKIINEGDAETILALLPNRNKDRNYISISNVQDLCTALEAEYNFSASITPNAKDISVIDLKKSIKKTIKEFSLENKSIKISEETNISSCFKYLDLNLKSKIYSLYEQHKDSVEIVRKKHISTEITLENIGEFVKLRNTKTHTGKVSWDDNANLYLPLLALTYACFFARSAIPEDKIGEIISQIF